MSDIFMSYVHGDREFVESLSKDLGKGGFSTWYDRDITPAKRWDSEIVDNLLRCHIVIVIMSEVAFKSEWVRYECSLGVALGKAMLVLITEPERIRPENLPDYLKSIQALEYTGSSSSEDLIKRIDQMDLPGRLSSKLCEGSVDICLPKEKFAKPDDKKVREVEGVNLRSMSVALGLQQQLLRRFGPFTQDKDPIGIRFLPDAGAELPSNRNYLILGGPGGVPFVHALLKRWTGFTHELESGYRFVTDRGRFFKQDTFLRQDRRTGIEDVQGRRIVQFFEYRPPQMAISGKNYVIIYTKGFDETSSDSSKIVIVAAFNREVLEGATSFLLDRQHSNRWFSQIRKCGTYTETLVEFEVGVGRSPAFQGYYEPRKLGR